MKLSPESLRLFLDFAQFMIVLIGAIWAYFRIWKEGIYRPKIQFDIGCNVFKSLNTEIPVEIQIKINNKGLMIHKFFSINLRVRGLANNQDLQFWKGNEPRLFFPEKLIEAEVIHKAKYNYVFVEPGVEQILTYVTKFTDSIELISVRAEFQYDQNKNHSIEKVYDFRHASKQDLQD